MVYRANQLYDLRSAVRHPCRRQLVLGGDEIPRSELSSFFHELSFAILFYSQMVGTARDKIILVISDDVTSVSVSSNCNSPSFLCDAGH